MRLLALVLRPGLAAGPRFELRVGPGDRRDVGILVVTPP